MNYSVHSVKDLLLDKNLLKILKGLTFSEGHSGMRTRLLTWKYLQKQGVNINAKVVIATSIHNRVVGWSLIDKDRDSLCMVYVHRSFRRRKIGTKLVSCAKKHNKPYPLRVVPWSNEAKRFFRSVKVI
jgi:GNAT superfamily N-acetyltransferase